MKVQRTQIYDAHGNYLKPLSDFNFPHQDDVWPCPWCERCGNTHYGDCLDLRSEAERAELARMRLELEFRNSVPVGYKRRLQRLKGGK
jgi:hypothetical protein